MYGGAAKASRSQCISHDNVSDAHGVGRNRAKLCVSSICIAVPSTPPASSEATPHSERGLEDQSDPAKLAGIPAKAAAGKRKGNQSVGREASKARGPLPPRVFRFFQRLWGKHCVGARSPRPSPVVIVMLRPSRVRSLAESRMAP